MEGPAQALSPVLQDEVYQIGREVLRNAFPARERKPNRGRNPIRHRCFVSEFGMMAKVSIAKSWRTVFVQAIGDCQGSGSEPNGSVRGWYSGAKPERARKWNWRSLPEWRMRNARVQRRFGLFRKNGDAS